MSEERSAEEIAKECVMCSYCAVSGEPFCRVCIQKHLRVKDTIYNERRIASQKAEQIADALEEMIAFAGRHHLGLTEVVMNADLVLARFKARNKKGEGE